MQLSDSTALVTGGNRGIGQAFVEELLDAGARKVYIGSRDPANASELVATDPNRLEVVELDISDSVHVARAAEQCSDVNLLVNNAGVFKMQTVIGAPTCRVWSTR